MMIVQAGARVALKRSAPGLVITGAYLFLRLAAAYHSRAIVQLPSSVCSSGGITGRRARVAGGSQGTHTPFENYPLCGYGAYEDGASGDNSDSKLEMALRL